MTNEEFILKLFAEETLSDPMKVYLEMPDIIEICNLIEISDPIDLVTGMVINQSIIRNNIPDRDNEFMTVEAFNLTEKGLKELKNLYSKEPIVKSGINLENELISFAVDIENSKYSTERKIEQKRILFEMLKCYNSECWNAVIGLCGKTLELCMLQIHEEHNIDTTSLVDRNGYAKKVGHLTLGQLFNNIKIKGIAKLILNNSQIETILYYRNGAAHYDGKTPIPSRDEGNAIISLTLGAVKRTLE